MKKLLITMYTVLSALVFFFSLASTSVFAATDDSNNTLEISTINEEYDYAHTAHKIYAISAADASVVQPMYIACPGGGKHTMQGNGLGDVINPSGVTILDNGYCFRCTKCGMVIISQHSPILGATYLGRYATGSGSVAYHTYMNVHYTSLSQLPYNSRLGGDTFTQSLSWVF